MTLSRTLGLAAALAAAPALGVDFSNPDWKWRLAGAEAAVSFRALDADDDGTLTRTEARAHPFLRRNFAAADLDRDGRLSPLEFNHAALELSQDPSSPHSGVLGMTVVEKAGRVVVSQVGRDTPAAAGGVRPGDVVLRFEGKPIARSRELYRHIVESVPGSLVELEVRRGDAVLRLPVRVEQVDFTPKA